MIILGKIVDLKGKRFGRLTVIEYAGLNKNRKAIWKCKCECGNEINVVGCNLKSGNTKSCGCYNHDKIMERNYKHNMSNTRLFRIWVGMIQRCKNKNNSVYSYYGGNGITICTEWEKDFEVFYKWAISNGYKENLTLDRKNNNGNYEPSNCRWVTIKEQQRNKTNNINVEINGITKILPEWAEMFNIKYKTIKNRYDEGKRGIDLIKPIEKANKNYSKNDIYTQQKLFDLFIELYSYIK